MSPYSAFAASSRAVSVRKVTAWANPTANSTIQIGNPNDPGNRFNYVRGYGGMEVAWSNFPETFPEDTELQARNNVYDLAYRMESSAPDAVDFSEESAVTKELYGLNDEDGTLSIIACFNNDLENFWDWIGSPYYPLRPSTEAFRVGTNLVIYSMTH